MLFNALGRAIGLAAKLNKGKGAVGAFKTIGNIADTVGTGALLYGASQLPKSIKEDILAAGPNDPDSDSQYGFKVGGPINSLALKVTGDTPKTLEETYKKRKRKELLADPLVAERVAALKLTNEQIEPNKILFLQQTQKEFDEYKQLKAVKDALKKEGVTFDPNADIASLSGLLKQTRRADITTAEGQAQYAVDQAKEKTLRDEQIRLDDLKLRRQQMRDEQAQADRNFNLQLQQLTNQNRRLDREDARAARKDQQALYAMLLQGLSNLNI